MFGLYDEEKVSIRSCETWTAGEKRAAAQDTMAIIDKIGLKVTGCWIMSFLKGGTMR